jgi:hypothetical protein
MGFQCPDEGLAEVNPDLRQHTQPGKQLEVILNFVALQCELFSEYFLDMAVVLDGTVVFTVNDLLLGT